METIACNIFCHEAAGIKIKMGIAATWCATGSRSSNKIIRWKEDETNYFILEFIDSERYGLSAEKSTKYTNLAQKVQLSRKFSMHSYNNKWLLLTQNSINLKSELRDGIQLEDISGFAKNSSGYNR